ncbi:MAG: type II secretion system F family protein [Gemmatales bacterium]|nr:type II secretion system F family protein [Gemmatales bacterium]MDW8386891.1 type II secretion system F family protein [Gemmatales bacterium]
MPEFAYTARIPSGQQTTGVLTANSEREVMALLDQRGMFPVRIEPVRKSGAAFFSLGRRIRSRYLATFYAQLADLLHAGVPLLRSLEILERQSTVPAMVEILKDVRARVADGTSLADAMAQHSRAFNELTVSMVRAGQEGGFLEDVLRRIADFTEHQEDLRAKVVGALAYPVFLSIIGTAIVSGLLIFLVPQFEEMFEQQRSTGDLPFLTNCLLSLSRFMWARPVGLPNIVWVFAALAGLFGVWWWWTSTPEGRLIVDGWKLKLPGAGPIYRNLAIARFCRILGTLLHNGIPILTALKIAKDSTGNRRLTLAIDQAAENVTGGQSLGPPLQASGYFPKDIVEMIAVGEESNSLERVLLNIADGLEKRTTRQLELFVRMLEPIMLLIMASITLVVVLALIQPFLNMGRMIK